MNWEMIEHLCISIAVVGAAITYIYKGVRAVKKPADDVNEKLARDFEKINKLESQQDYNSRAIKLLMRGELAMLGHLATNNNDGEMAKVEADIQEFLLNN